MKKSRILMSVAIAASGMFLLNSCGKTLGCASSLVKITTAASEFASDTSAANCLKYKNALNDWLNNSSCSQADSATKALFQEDLADLGC
jgi:hypothetical protein